MATVLDTSGLSPETLAQFALIQVAVDLFYICEAEANWLRIFLRGSMGTVTFSDQRYAEYLLTIVAKMAVTQP
jgi:hypothetical protein